MKVLITGGAGFIGSNLARYLRQQDDPWDIRIVDDLSNGRLENLEGVECDFVQDSILNVERLNSVARGVDAIVHLAAIGSVPRSVADPGPTHHANATGTFNVLEAARAGDVGHLIVASSSSVYGSNPALPKSEFDWTRPMSPYAASKLATEAYTLAYNFSYGLKTVAFRFFNVYGPAQPADHDYAAVIPKFLDAALTRRPLTVFGDGLQSRDFTYVKTVCATIHRALRDETSSQQPVNLAFGTNTTLLDLIARIEAQLGYTVDVEHFESRVGDVRASQSDGVRVREIFPSVEPTPLDVGLAETLRWFRSQRAAP